MKQHAQANSSMWKWLLIGGGIALILVGGWVMASTTVEPTVNGILDIVPAASLGGATGFTALASQLRFNHEHREGPGSDLLEGSYEGEDTGFAIRVFRTETATRMAYLIAESRFDNLSLAQREAVLRAAATQLESAFPETDILIAYRGRTHFGASAIKMAGEWTFQTGTSIDENALGAFFSNAVPPDDFTTIASEPLVVRGTTREGEGKAEAITLDAGFGTFTLMPQARVLLAAPHSGLSVRVRGSNEIADVVILLRQPDGRLRSVRAIAGTEARLEGAFPVGNYDVWVGGIGPANPFELAITATTAELPNDEDATADPPADFTYFVATLNEMNDFEPWYEGVFSFDFLRITCEDNDCQLWFRAHHIAEERWHLGSIPVRRDELQREHGRPSSHFFDGASEALTDWEHEHTPD